MLQSISQKLKAYEHFKSKLVTPIEKTMKIIEKESKFRTCSVTMGL